MAEARDVNREGTGTSIRGEVGPARDRARSEEEFDRRARYLAKAASLGHVVTEDESLEGGH